MLFKAFVGVFLFFLLCVDAKGRGGRAKIRTGSYSDSSTKSSNNSQTGILGTIFFLLSCGCGIFWRLNKCLGKKQHRQQQMHYYITENPEQIFNLDQRNQKYLSSKRENIIPSTLISDLSVGKTSEKMLNNNVLERTKVQHLISSRETIV